MNYLLSNQTFSLSDPLFTKILTGVRPYPDISNDDAEALFELEKFPETANICVGDVILDCRMGKFESVDEVDTRLRAVYPKATHFISSP